MLNFYRHFNVGCSRWWNSGVTSLIDSEIGNLTSSSGYKQIIEKPTHIISNYLPVYISYFVTTRTRFQSSIFGKCYHIIIYGSVNIRVSLSRNYIGKVWDYRKAMLKIFNKLYLILIEQRLLKPFY